MQGSAFSLDIKINPNSAESPACGQDPRTKNARAENKGNPRWLRTKALSRCGGLHQSGSMLMSGVLAREEASIPEDKWVQAIIFDSPTYLPQRRKAVDFVSVTIRHQPDVT